MDGFKKALQEYESKMFAPYDRGGAYFDEEEYQLSKEDYLEMEADKQIEEMRLGDD